MANEERRDISTEINCSVLDQLRVQLYSRTDTLVAGEIISNDGFGGWTETVRVIVAPKRPIYEIYRLNEYMDGLIIGIKPSCRDDAFPYMESGIHLGRLYFDETLGIMQQEIRTVITELQPGALLQAGIKIGETKKKREDPLQRRTWVRPYPDVDVAKIAYEYEIGVMNGAIEPDSRFKYLQHWITGDQLRELKRNNNPFFKLAGLIK